MGTVFFLVYHSFTTQINLSFQAERIRKTIMSCPSKAKLNLPRNDHGFSVFASCAMVCMELWHLP